MSKLRPSMRSRVALLALGGAACAAIVVSFFVGRTIAGSGAAADDHEPWTPPADFEQATPLPGETPDTTQPFWYRKWYNEEDTEPRYDQFVNGILVGPTVLRTDVPCGPDRPPVNTTVEEAEKSRVAIRLGYTPEGVFPIAGGAVACGGEVVGYEVWLELSTAPDASDRIKAGEPYRDVPHGGLITVYRAIMGPAFETSIPAERWFSGEVAGHPAAIAPPLLESEGFGESAIIVHVNGILTAVRGSDVTLDELMRVAEGVVLR